ncbi:4-alpha-glucanotransferase [Stenotrophomonas sp. NPDC077464]|uniref:4-alpha-glucanotransferase n=1 Tax=unclassified Stenotrophomonas TaxID=196198 RepID=UPI0037D076E4
MNSMPSLADVADAAGVLVRWTDVAGQPQRVADGALAAILARLGLSVTTPAQRRESLHWLASHQHPGPLRTAVERERVIVGPADAACVWVHEDGSSESTRTDAAGGVDAPARPGYWSVACAGQVQQVAVAPARCFGVDDALGAEAHAWGLVLQPYAARHPHDAGIGDTAACAAWADHAAAAGADALALGPVHAANAIDPLYSPYSPGDRRYLEALYAAPVAVFGECALQVLDTHPTLRAELDRLRNADLIDWPAVASAKWSWLAEVQRASADDAATRAALQRFVDQGGSDLAAHVAFMHARLALPAPLYLFGQWLVSCGWQQAQQKALASGMRLGLIADLAVGFDPYGAEAAAGASACLRGLVLGAPPDAFCSAGQVWGVSSYAPLGLQAQGFAPFIALLRAVMRDRGGIRVDHILGWQRLWVVPEGADAGQGAYLRYPLRDLLNLVAIESWRHRCIVIGEDLGVVPPGIRQTLAARGVLGMDVLAFSRGEDGRFLAPAQWRAEAVAMTGTHDLPTLVGWRRGLDLGWRHRLGELDTAGLKRETTARRADVVLLDTALGEGVLEEDDARRAALAFVASGPSALALLPVEDALGLAEQVNLPGTVGSHPNWRQRLPREGCGQTLHTSMAAFAGARARVPA